MMKRFLIAIIFFPAFAMAEEDCGKINSCNYSSMWGDFSNFTVTYSNSKGEKGSPFEFVVSDKQSLMKFETQNGTAQIFSIPGVAILWQGIGITGIKSSQECRSDVQDTYAIIQSYAVRALFFLGYSVKGRPETVSEDFIINLANDEDTKVQINPGDHMMIRGPWSLNGHIKKGKEITFKIAHKFMGRNGAENLFLSGIWKNTPYSMPIKNSESLSNWLVCMTGKYSYEDGKSVFTPAVKDTSKLKNVGHLRALTNQSSSPTKGVGWD